jgi:hypothetical protein
MEDKEGIITIKQIKNAILIPSVDFATGCWANSLARQWCGASCVASFQSVHLLLLIKQLFALKKLDGTIKFTG